MLPDFAVNHAWTEMEIGVRVRERESPITRSHLLPSQRALCFRRRKAIFRGQNFATHRGAKIPSAFLFLFSHTEDTLTVRQRQREADDACGWRTKRQGAAASSSLSLDFRRLLAPGFAVVASLMLLLSVSLCNIAANL